MTAELAVVGLGYVGLPLARQACSAGVPTVGYDIAEPVVAAVRAGRSPVSDVPDVDLARMAKAGFTATTDPAVLGTVQTVVLCVPTGLTERGKPDLRAVRAAGATVAARLRPGMLVVLESTGYPGTTEEVLRPVLESGSGLRAGEDFHLAFSPERIDPGNTSFGVGTIPKVVSGLTPLCAKHCAVCYGRFVDSVVVARGTREAELAKLLENSYRYVNIALVNEIAMYCDRVGLDVWDVLHCAGTKPFGFAPFQPGPGVGGHCIPVDPLYLATKARREGFPFSMLAAARAVNDGMPDHVVRRAAAELGRPLRGARVLLLGVTYKPDVPDIRESPALAVAEALHERGATVGYHDPYVAELVLGERHVRSVDDLPAAVAAAELTVLLQDHSCYDPTMLARTCRCLLDTRGKVAGRQVCTL